MLSLKIPRWALAPFTVVTLLVLLVAPVGPLAQPESPLDLTPYKGKVVLLDFWASWCGPCGRSFPWMTQMQDQYGDSGLVVVTVNLDADRAAADAFLKDHPGAFEHVFDSDGVVAEAYGVVTMPTSIVIDREGRPVLRHDGFRPKQTDDYERNLVAVLEGTVGKDPLDLMAAGGDGVKPWERDLLSRPGMQFGFDALELAFDDHIYFSKEASSGGRGFGGGGCGCN